jgi:DNA mismatch repair ATPase MutL
MWEKKPFGEMRIIGQLHNSYIVCESKQGLILIDQHAAHERVLFEQFDARSTGAKKSAQRLLVPETVELGYREAGVLEKLIPELEDMGLEVEPFGGNSRKCGADRIRPRTGRSTRTDPHGAGLSRCHPRQPGFIRAPDPGPACPAR